MKEFIINAREFALSIKVNNFSSINTVSVGPSTYSIYLGSQDDYLYIINTEYHELGGEQGYIKVLCPKTSQSAKFFYSYIEEVEMKLLKYRSSDEDSIRFVEEEIRYYFNE